MGGHAIGILVMELGYPIIPGMVANATTYDFPVRYAVVKLTVPPTQIFAGDKAFVEPMISAARGLEQDGVKAIVGACGYFANYQREMTAALSVPVFTSSLLQIPIIQQSLPRGKKIGVICANSAALTPATLAAVGVHDTSCLAIAGLENEPEFRTAVLDGSGTLDVGRVETEVVGAAKSLAESHDLAAVLLECSDLPPFALAVQRAVRLPVFDFITMIYWVKQAVVQREYRGFI